MANPEFECPTCGNKTRTPEWNPYEGYFECYECGEDMQIDADPRTAEFYFHNQNPNF